MNLPARIQHAARHLARQRSIRIALLMLAVPIGGWVVHFVNTAVGFSFAGNSARATALHVAGTMALGAAIAALIRWVNLFPEDDPDGK